MTHPNWSIRRLSTFTFEEAVRLWNDGWSGYYSDMSRTLEGFVAAIGASGIHPQSSVVLCVNGEPAGFIHLAIKTVRGEKYAWNGGTAIVPKFRGKGLAKPLMHAAVDVMREEGVQTGILEVVCKNVKAIAMYESGGFRKVDHVIGLKRSGTLAPGVFAPENGRYRTETGRNTDAEQLAFYRRETAWSGQWFNLDTGEAVIAYDDGEPVGYALCKRRYDEWGKPASVSLHHCETKPGRPDGEAITRVLLDRVFAAEDGDYVRTTDNLSTGNGAAVRLLQDAGFETVYEQYVMYWRPESVPIS